MIGELGVLPGEAEEDDSAGIDLVLHEHEPMPDELVATG